MSDQIQNIVTKIGFIEDSATQVKLKDENKKSLGSFFKAKKDGNPTQAYQQYQDMGLKAGSVVQIGFKEVPYKDGTIKNIIGFRETNDVPAPQAKAPQAARPNTYHSEEPKGRDFDKENVGKCQTLFLQSFIQSGHTFSEAKQQHIQARQLAELVVYGTQRPDDAPLPEPVGEITGDDIGF